MWSITTGGSASYQLASGHAYVDVATVNGGAVNAVCTVGTSASIKFGLLEILSQNFHITLFLSLSLLDSSFIPTNSN